MNKKQNRILIWALAWAGLFVAVLYSPVGSPDLYTPMYIVEATGVDFSTTTIQNAPRGRYSGSNNSSALVMPAGDQLGAISSSYTPSPSAVSTSVTSYSDVSSQGSQLNYAGSGGGGSVGLFAAKNGGKGSNEGTNTGFSVTSGSSNTAIFEGTTQNKQAGPYVPQTGATDPGEDPIGDPIPVGDGLPLLLILVGAYVGWKKVKLSYL